MRIRKTSFVRDIAGKIVNIFNQSQENAYSCDYINDELENKLTNIKMSSGRYIKSIELDYHNNRWCLKAIIRVDGNDYNIWFYPDDGNI